MNIQYSEGSMAEARALLAQLPEFTDLYPLEEFQRRLQGPDALILLAKVEGQAIGCKLGYRLNETCFYSWLGGVLPQWRRSGAARLLAEAQEAWAHKRGFSHVRFKTRNSCRAMLLFALKRNFNIIRVEPRESPIHHRIWLERALVE
ncbi:GNAT family N-acetyltransferase [Cesiribacter andamanensis]|uniref:N-acetyltransferase domain-containing protein n=1 Tax=Cesiribacter andamanensis AMV16 TaxID=1279009 RepID=M7N1R8_9BACT|nr:GNAT family N-acetyltransferase [Cesiribacter andamanensis]EMR01166.1 hypothetical protein ADICEAN_03713 [Cesiribacter andamanensis AMV16]